MRYQSLLSSAPSSLLARFYAPKLNSVRLIQRRSKLLYSTMTSTPSAPSQPEDLKPLFLKAKQNFPSSLRDDKWYLTAVILPSPELLFPPTNTPPDRQPPEHRPSRPRRLSLHPSDLRTGIPDPHGAPAPHPANPRSNHQMHYPVWDPESHGGHHVGRQGGAGGGHGLHADSVSNQPSTRISATKAIGPGVLTGPPGSVRAGSPTTRTASAQKQRSRRCTGAMTSASQGRSSRIKT